MKATEATKKAQERLKGLCDEQLFDIWEMTTTNNDANIYTVRGWLMEEIERRFPVAFEKFLESDEATDEDLRKYCLA